MEEIYNYPISSQILKDRYSNLFEKLRVNDDEICKVFTGREGDKIWPSFVETIHTNWPDFATVPTFKDYANAVYKKLNITKKQEEINKKLGKDYSLDEITWGILRKCYSNYPSLITERAAFNYVYNTYGNSNKVKHDDTTDMRSKLDFTFEKNGQMYGVHLFQNSTKAKEFAIEKEKRNKHTIKGVIELYLERITTDKEFSVSLYKEKDLDDLFEHPEKHLWSSFLDKYNFC